MLRKIYAERKNVKWDQDCNSSKVSSWKDQKDNPINKKVVNVRLRKLCKIKKFKWEQNCKQPPVLSRKKQKIILINKNLAIVKEILNK